MQLSPPVLQHFIQEKKGILIEEAVCSLLSKPIHDVTQLNNIAHPFMKNVHYRERQRKLLRVTHVFIDVHSFQRWNERVGPIISLDTLTSTLNNIIRLNPNRFHLISDDTAVLDEDIVLVYEIDGTQLTIFSFYGRISYKPALSNFRRMKKFCNHHGETVNLALNYDELQAQHMPILPNEVIQFSTNRKNFTLEKYYLQDSPYPYYQCYEYEWNSYVTKRYVINAKKTQRSISTEILTVLFKLGDYEFLSAYFHSKQHPNVACTQAEQRGLLQNTTHKKYELVI